MFYDFCSLVNLIGTWVFGRSLIGLLFCVLQVRVTVLDKNDVAPTWGAEPWRFEVSEEAPPNTIVTVLKAHDPDTIGTLTYTLVPNRKADNAENNNLLQNKVDSPFKLDPTTGQLRLAEALDRETKDKYILRARADDGVQHTDITLTIVVSLNLLYTYEKRKFPFLFCMLYLFSIYKYEATNIGTNSK